MKLPKNSQATDYRDLRMAAGLSATDLSEMLGVTRETISRRENGQLKINLEAWLALQAVCEEAMKLNWSYKAWEKNQTDETQHDETPKHSAGMRHR